MSITEIAKHLKLILKKLGKYLLFILGGWLMAWILLSRKKADEEITRAENEEKEHLDNMSDSDIIAGIESSADILRVSYDARERMHEVYGRARDRMAKRNRAAFDKMRKRIESTRERMDKRDRESNNRSSGNSGSPAPG